MAEGLKTVENDGDVGEFLNSVENARRREDAWKVLRMMERVTGEKPRMWGTSIVGFGRYTYRRSDRSEHTFNAHRVLAAKICPCRLHHARVFGVRRPDGYIGQAPALGFLPLPDTTGKRRFRGSD